MHFFRSRRNRRRSDAAQRASERKQLETSVDLHSPLRKVVAPSSSDRALSHLTISFSLSRAQSSAHSLLIVCSLLRERKWCSCTTTTTTKRLSAGVRAEKESRVPYLPYLTGYLKRASESVRVGYPPGLNIPLAASCQLKLFRAVSRTGCAVRTFFFALLQYLTVFQQIRGSCLDV